MTALAHTQQNGQPARPEAARRTTHAGQAESSAERKARPESAGEASSLFGELLLTTPFAPQSPVITPWEGTSTARGQLTPTQEAPASPARAWQQLEPVLCGMVEKQPTGPVSMTLLLPILGEVDARIGPFAAGWDISLRFAPQAMSMIAPHQERCRESLRRRMACPVRLRFEQRGGQQ
ncbi:type III secretion system HrpP C-terminal domain-containing protein [Vagococcus sp. WN89Y]|uniref:type III secretion system HrpP C-terminal domain-containing protein n=1 Tax=Vagococcus sp. WN89Y TaxID=3457258 RepID=UPI003FCCF080